MAKRGPKNKVEQLDPGIKRELDRLIFDEGRSYDDVVAWLQSLRLEETPSRSSIARYSATAQRFREDMERMQTVTQQLVNEFGEADNDVARMLIQIAQSIAFKVMDNAGKESTGPSIEELMFLLKGIRDLTAARKSTLDAEEKVLTRLKKVATQMIDQAAKDAAAAGEPGLSAERIVELRRRVLGLRL